MFWLQVLKLSKVDLLISNSKLSAPFLDDMKDGFILQSEHIAKRTGSQILLNIYCNDKMNFQDGSCCSSAEPYTYLQIVTFVVLFLWWVKKGTLHLTRRISCWVWGKGQSDRTARTVTSPTLAPGCSHILLLRFRNWYVIVAYHTRFFIFFS